MSVIDYQVEEVEVEGGRVIMEPRGGHFRVFYETTQGAQAVEKVRINWNDSKTFTQSVDEMYSSLLFYKDKTIN